MFWMVACHPPQTEPPVESRPRDSAPADPVPLSDFRPQTIILVNADTLRSDRLPAYGSPRDTMPLFNARAAHQVRASAWATSGWTPTSVPSLLTSQEIHGHGVVGVEGLEYQKVDGQMLHEWLGENGVQTAFFSSNHVLPSTSVVEGWGDYQLVDDLWSSDKLVDATLSWLEDQGPSEPVFVMLQPMDTHHPWLPPDAFRGTFVQESDLLFPISRDTDAQVEAVKAAYMSGSPEQRAALVDGLLAVYDEEILGLDASLERLLLGLEAQGRLEDSLLILTADHGESLYDAPDQLLHGGTLRQEVIGIPLLFYSPSIVSANLSEGSCIASGMDVWPTLAPLLNLPTPAGLSGINLLDDCRTVARAELFERPPNGDYALTEVVALSATGRLEHQCDRGQRYSYDLLADPYGLQPVPGVTTQTQDLAAPLDEALDALLTRWPEQRCLGR